MTTQDTPLSNHVSPLRILIVGCGYVGCALGQLLASQGHQIWGMRRNTDALPKAIQPLQADLSGNFESALTTQPWDIVYYTASASGFSESAYQAAYISQVKRLLQALEGLEKPPKRFIYTSSTGVYHQQDGSWLDEQSSVAPRSFSSRALLEGEALVHASNIPGVVVRLAGIYGPGRTRLIDQVVQGKATCVRGRTTLLNLIHRDDCAGILAHLATYPNPASCYLAVDASPVEKDELLQWIAAQLALPAPPVIDAADAPPLKRGGNRRYSNRQILETGYTFKYPSCREGYRELLDAYLQDR